MTETAAATIGPARRTTRRWWLFATPAAVFGAVAVGFGIGLGRDPRLLPSALVGKPVPKFALLPVEGRALGISSEDLKGEVSLVNFFASWCVSCLLEHPVFMRLKQERIVPVHGVNYKDAPADAAAWLEKHGDPYVRTGADRNGRVGIEFGVYGVPETYVVGRDARIHYRHVGPLTEEAFATTLLPLVEKLRR